MLYLTFLMLKLMIYTWCKIRIFDSQLFFPSSIKFNFFIEETAQFAIFKINTHLPFISFFRSFLCSTPSLYFPIPSFDLPLSMLCIQIESVGEGWMSERKIVDTFRSLRLRVSWILCDDVTINWLLDWTRYVFPLSLCLLAPKALFSAHNMYSAHFSCSDCEAFIFLLIFAIRQKTIFS